MGVKSETLPTGARVLERGDIFFFYRTKFNQPTVRGLEDISEFQFLLHPTDEDRYRLLNASILELLGSSGIPENRWLRVHKVDSVLREITDDLRGKHTLKPAIPCGEGVYALVRHADHTHLAYALELPEEPGEAQTALGIEKEANPILSVRNPIETALEGERTPQVVLPRYPARLMERFGDRQFLPVDPVHFLDFEGADLLLTDLEGHKPKELGLDLYPEHENEQTAEILGILKVKHIIVCGHYGCGGVRASIEDRPHGLVDNWIRSIRDIYLKNPGLFSRLKSKEAKVNRLCELNVISQVYNVSQTTVVQEAWKRGQDLTVHGWIYSLENGLLKDLDVCISTKQRTSKLDFNQ